MFQSQSPLNFEVWSIEFWTNGDSFDPFKKTPIFALSLNLSFVGQNDLGKAGQSGDPG